MKAAVAVHATRGGTSSYETERVDSRIRGRAKDKFLVLFFSLGFFGWAQLARRGAVVINTSHCC